MKILISILFVAASCLLKACSNDSSSKDSKVNDDTISKEVNKTTNNEQKNGGSINDVISAYLNVKNALTADNRNEAASAANQITASLAKVDESVLTADQKKVYNEVKDDINEHAQHIGSSESDLEHQREHFDLLSQDVIDLVKSTGSSQTLYEDFCPMYNNKKGASWLSETKDISNPYYGKKMLECGEVKEEIKPRG